MSFFAKACSALFVAVVVAGCGGGGLSTPPPIIIPPIDISPPISTPCIFDCEDGDNGGGGSTPTTGIPAPNPSDGLNYRSTEFNSNYGLAAINADRAYQRGYFGAGVTVGVIDTGVRTTHRELDDNVVTGRDFVFPSTPAVDDPDGHGTAVAAVIAAGRNNGNGGMHGVAPRARIMPLKIADSNGRLVGDWRAAIRHAASRNVPIVNNSFGDVGEELIGDYQGTIYRAEVPFLRGFYNDNRRRLAQEVAGIVRNRDITAVWAAGNGGWNAQTGRIRMYQCAPGQERRPQNCQGAFISVTRNQFVTGFNHQNHYDYDRNFVQGEGFLSNTDGSDIPDLSSYYSSMPLWAVSGIDGLLDGLERGTISETTFARRLLDDSNFRAMASRWLAVVATDRNNNIASFSNGCGLAVLWCLAAPGSAIYTADTSAGAVGYNAYNGTSFAAPHVSGALAVLKSRLPSVPMSVIVAIMLTTATDRGTPGLDETYGWGLLNLDAAIRYSGRLSVQTASSAVRLSGAQINLPSAMSHIAPRLASTQIAVGGVGDAYFNLPLSDVVRVSAAAAAPLGDAAADMFAPQNDGEFGAGIFFAATDNKTNQFRYAGANVSLGGLGGWSFRHDFCDDCEHSAWREWETFAADADVAAPFFARDGGGRFALQMRGDGLRPFAAFGGEVHSAGDSPYQQFGFRWRKNGGGFGAMAEISQINEAQSFLGADFGAFGKTSAKTGQGRFAVRGDLGRNWRGVAMWERAYSDVQAAGDSILVGVEDVRAEGWMLGVEGGGVFLADDKLRFSVRRKTAIRRGRAVLQHTTADGDFTAAFYRNIAGASEELQNAAQTLHLQKTEIALDGEPSTTFAVGYAMTPMQNARLAFGLEHDTQTDNSAISTRLQINF